MEVRERYKQTEVGIIPEDWDVKHLLEVGVPLQGLTYSPRDVCESGTLVLRSSNIQNSKLSFEDCVYVDMDIPATVITEHNDILICVRNGSKRLIGKSALITKDIAGAAFGAFMSVIRSNDSGYVFFQFQSNIIQNQIRNRMGATINQITGRDLSEFIIPFPPESEERDAIATALTDVNSLITNLDKLIAKKQDIKQATMQELLTGKTRLPGFTGDWEEKTLGSLGRFLKGSGIKKDEANSGQLPCIRYGEIYTDHHNIIRGFTSWISRDIAETAQRIYPGDVLFAGSGETKEDIGKCVALTEDIEAYAGGDVVILRTNDVDPTFMGYLCNTKAVNNQKSSLGQGDAVVHISAKALSGIILKLPKKPEQKAIATILSDMDKEIEALEERREKTLLLKQGMMQELLTGKTRLVKPATKDTQQSQPNTANIHFQRSVLAAEIVSRLHEEPTFGHVKFEKMIFLVEHLCDIDTGSNYQRKAAGPYDNRALRSIDSQLKKQNWFEARKVHGRYTYVPLEKANEHGKYFDRYFSDKRDSFTNIIDTFRSVDTERCEIVATLYSAWNDLLQQQTEITDERIIHEVLNNWHESKKRIPEERWQKALAWMREKGFVPTL